MMPVRSTLRLAAFALTLAAGFVLPAAAEDEIHIPKQEWHHDGAFGTYDRAQLQRGFQVYSKVCATCHSMSLLSYRHLAALGYSEPEIKAIASQVQVQDGPNDQGEMYERPGLPSDHFKAPFANEKAARAANNGALPKDLSLIVKARKGGEDYVYALLTGYTDPPPGVKVPDGQYYNKAFPGHLISMPPPLQDGIVSYADGTQATVPQMAKDVAAFLAWASEPKLEERKRIGAKVMIFLGVFTALMYLVKRKVWADVH
ncbi:MAG: cytochrome c1 [Rhodospirillales bacterium]|nr:cytochrome c1 [Rhodospirillales bacterium]